MLGQTLGRPCRSSLRARSRRLTKPGLHGDGEGLYLRVSPTGAKSWILRTVVHAKRRDIGLGGVTPGVAGGSPRTGPQPSQGGETGRRSSGGATAGGPDVREGRADGARQSRPNVAKREARAQLDGLPRGLCVPDDPLAPDRHHRHGGHPPHPVADLDREARHRGARKAAAVHHLRLGQGCRALPPREPRQRRQEGAAADAPEAGAHGRPAVAGRARVRRGPSGARGGLGALPGVPDPHGVPLRRGARRPLGRDRRGRLDGAGRAHEAGHSAPGAAHAPRRWPCWRRCAVSTPTWCSRART